MFRFLLPAVFVCAAWCQQPYELSGRFSPEERASVSLFGVASPFVATLMSEDGRFTFKKLQPGAYTIAVFVPARGEARQTVEVGPGTADAHQRVQLTLNLKESDFVLADALRRHSVPATQLAVPEKAVREYEDAQKDLNRRDIAAAVKRLEHAVEIAPQFSAAWNNLGTIAYQTQKYERAAECFRAALEADPTSYEPLVNLGGVLINLHDLDSAWKYNVYAVLLRPTDALANSQLGMTYFEIGKMDLAEKYFVAARQIDPAHFSHPQLFLAEIHLRRGDRSAAARDLEDFLKYHPDWPQAAKMREQIGKLR
ncbi:TPR repeat-containing protein [Candidatus Sulfopaludibacter sp. SbA4]|nr:TPR repeat-containing protein [Candidatus Sulfopaludibacter sp. SbA4]